MTAPTEGWWAPMSDDVMTVEDRIDITERSSELALRKLVELDQSATNVMAITNDRIDGMEKELDVLYDALWDAQENIEELERTNSVLVLAIVAFAALLLLSWAT